MDELEKMRKDALIIIRDHMEKLETVSDLIREDTTKGQIVNSIMLASIDIPEWFRKGWGL